MRIQTTCKSCGRVLWAVRRDMRYCCGACRQRDYRRRERARASDQERAAKGLPDGPLRPHRQCDQAGRRVIDIASLIG